MHQFLMRLTKNRPMRLIEINGDAYLERYHIASIFGFKIWLHRFIRNDSERHLHNHPWHALSVILTGGYREIVALDGYRNLDIVDYEAGNVNVIRANKTHRILRVEPNTWTLMLVSPRVRKNWFFVNDDGDMEAGPNGGSDWHKTAHNRAKVYNKRFWSAMKDLDIDVHKLRSRIEEWDNVRDEYYN